MSNLDWQNIINIEKSSDSQKVNLSILILVLAFLAILSRLFFLQVMRGSFYKEQAQDNTTYILTQAAPRGIIYDRDHRVLASNKQSPSVIILPSIIFQQDIEKTSRKLALILKKSPKEIQRRLNKLNKKDSRPFTFESNLSLNQVAAIYENQIELPGITIQQQAARYYTHGKSLSHVLGYTGEVSEAEINNNPDRKLHDLIGKYGIEKLLDEDLRGINAYQGIKINRYGQPAERVDLNNVNSSKPSSGKDITLTIDLDIQKAAEKAMKSLKGAVVVVDTQTGEVLALVSKPDFDPNLFTSRVSVSLWKQISEQKAFLNRAISAYAPGSIWKPLVLLVALETKAVKPDEKIAVSGAYYLGNTRFGDWTSATGIFTLQKALAWSRDTAFYKMAVRMSDKSITEWGKKFGAGQKTGIELQDESIGCIPDEAWKAKHLKSRWYPGYTLHYSIGQGYLQLTPVQAARLTAALANNGIVPKLTLIKQIGDQLPKRPSLERFKISETATKVVKEGMLECVETGTCQASKLPGIKIAGKTGSAEAPPNRKTHGWFASYAPVDKPEIAIIVFAEAGGHGGSVAAPVAKDIYLAYFRKYHKYKLPGQKENNEENLPQENLTIDNAEIMD